jgi:hypothetical protein
MRKSNDLDNLLENAVALALGLSQPHSDMPRKRRARAHTPTRHRQGKLVAPTHRHAHAA